MADEDGTFGERRINNANPAGRNAGRFFVRGERGCDVYGYVSNVGI
jgi:hypothetical protein